MHYLGSDIRGKTPEQLAYGKRADAQVVGSYDAIRWVPEAEVIPPGVDLSRIEPVPPSDRVRPLIVHAPSSRRRKGSEHVIAAVEGLDADLELVEGLHHDEAFERYRAADIVVDQLNAGWYGLFAIEAMALGKPVVTFLHDEAVRLTEEAFGTRVPIVSATAETLRETLRPLVADAAAAASSAPLHAPTSSACTTSSGSPTACSISTLGSEQWSRPPHLHDQARRAGGLGRGVARARAAAAATPRLRGAGRVGKRGGEHVHLAARLRRPRGDRRRERRLLRVARAHRDRSRPGAPHRGGAAAAGARARADGARSPDETTRPPLGRTGSAGSSRACSPSSCCRSTRATSTPRISAPSA